MNIPHAFKYGNLEVVNLTINLTGENILITPIKD